MKFNKSAESEKWYVESDSSEFCLGIIQKDPDWTYYFEQSRMSRLNGDATIEIGNFMKQLERESGIDTTSTFKSNSEGAR